MREEDVEEVLGPERRTFLYLTFDDGPWVGTTEVLQALEEAGVKGREKEWRAGLPDGMLLCQQIWHVLKALYHVDYVGVYDNVPDDFVGNVIDALVIVAFVLLLLMLLLMLLWMYVLMLLTAVAVVALLVLLSLLSLLLLMSLCL